MVQRCRLLLNQLLNDRPTMYSSSRTFVSGFGGPSPPPPRFTALSNTPTTYGCEARGWFGAHVQHLARQILARNSATLAHTRQEKRKLGTLGQYSWLHWNDSVASSHSNFILEGFSLNHNQILMHGNGRLGGELRDLFPVVLRRSQRPMFLFLS